RPVEDVTMRQCQSHLAGLVAWAAGLLLFDCRGSSLAREKSASAAERHPAAPQVAVAAARVIKVTAKKFEFKPAVITVKKGELVELELTTSDRRHGFDAPELAIHAEIKPGAPTKVQFKPDKAGHFPFHCSVFCGDGHEEMTGEIVVTE
ncbi:MAG TPA: cupredoxin domain-containing protein, partial [Polyangia bacterium]